MTVKVRFHLVRKRDMNSNCYKTYARWSLNSDWLSMNELQHIVDNYAISCNPRFYGDDRPMVDGFDVVFEDHMYSAFILAIT